MSFEVKIEIENDFIIYFSKVKNEEFLTFFS